MRRRCARITALLTALPAGCLIAAVPANAAMYGKPNLAVKDSYSPGTAARPPHDKCPLKSPTDPVSSKPQRVGAGFTERDLVSDIPGRAEATDPNLVNPWGMSSPPGGPVRVSDNGSNKSTEYSGAQPGQPVQIMPSVVSIPGSGAPTGQAFNDSDDFRISSGGIRRPAKFIFAGEEGDISGWNPDVSPTDAILAAHVDNAVYKGLALITDNVTLLPNKGHEPSLLAANFRAGRVDVFDEAFNLLPPGDEFQDPDIPEGFAPFNVAAIDWSVFVTYAKQNADKHDDVAGPGNGFIDEFDRDGNLLRRFAQEGVLNSPWGMVLAPPRFGEFSCDLLVGNFGDGRINVFDRDTGELKGTLTQSDGTDIVIPGLWGLLRGNNAAGGPDSVWFAAGIEDETHGLLGVLRATCERTPFSDRTLAGGS